MILITAFEPFNNEKINPSSQILDEITDSEVIKIKLPVSYDKATKVLEEAFIKYKPDKILLLGQAGGRRNVTVEYYALNTMSASIPDNDKILKNGEEIDKNGSIAYRTNLDVFKLNKLYPNIGISYHAGTFICNEVLYFTLNYIHKNKLSTIADFCHVPYLDIQVVDKPNMPSMTLEDMKKDVDSIIKFMKQL